MKKSFLLLLVLVSLLIGFVAYAQEQTEPVDEPVIEEDVDLQADEDVNAEDLGIEEPKILPDHPLYWFKNAWRKIREVFVFNPVAKLELKQRFASERALELKKLIEKGANPKQIAKAARIYDKEGEGIKQKVMKLKQTADQNPRLNSFYDKYVQQSLLHYRILQNLEEHLSPEVAQKIREQREKHLERFKDVMLKLEDKEKLPERLDKAMRNVKGGQFKDFKNLEMLNELKERMPEDVRERMMEMEKKRLDSLREKIEQLPPEKQEKLDNYLRKVSGRKESYLKILEDLGESIENPQAKAALKRARQEVMKKIQERVGPNCPLLVRPACEDGRVVPRKDDKGCIFLDCIQKGDITDQGDCKAVCLNVGTKNEGWYNSCTKKLIRYTKCQETQKNKPIRQACIELWDPVCGKDGKTYSNTCFAKVAGVEITHRGVCKSPEGQKEMPGGRQIPRALPLQP
jgi:hypothetical protein